MLVFKRPEPRPKLFEGSDYGTLPVVTDGKLLLLRTDTKKVDLEDLDGQNIKAHEFRPEEGWIGEVHTGVKNYRGVKDRVVFKQGPRLITGLKNEPMQGIV